MNARNRNVKVLLAGLLFAVLAWPALRALEFKPEFITTVNEDGFATTEIVLKDGASRVVYCPPAAWKAEEGERFLRFHAPGVSLADLTIEAEKVEGARTLDAAAAERCRVWLKASVPKECTDIALEPDEPNPGAIAACPTFATTVAYTSGGTRYRKRVLFVFAPDAEIRITTAARSADFDRLYPAVRRSLFSWRWERLR